MVTRFFFGPCDDRWLFSALFEVITCWIYGKKWKCHTIVSCTTDKNEHREIGPFLLLHALWDYVSAQQRRAGSNWSSEPECSRACRQRTHVSKGKTLVCNAVQHRAQSVAMSAPWRACLPPSCSSTLLKDNYTQAEILFLCETPGLRSRKFFFFLTHLLLLL